MPAFHLSQHFLTEIVEDKFPIFGESHGTDINHSKPAPASKIKIKTGGDVRICLL
jgi:hypothetical protein